MMWSKDLRNKNVQLTKIHSSRMRFVRSSGCHQLYGGPCLWSLYLGVTDQGVYIREISVRGGGLCLGGIWGSLSGGEGSHDLKSDYNLLSG